VAAVDHADCTGGRDRDPARTRVTVAGRLGVRGRGAARVRRVHVADAPAARGSGNRAACWRLAAAAQADRIAAAAADCRRHQWACRSMIEWHVLTGEYPPQPGGVSDYTRQVARGLAN